MDLKAFKKRLSSEYCYRIELHAHTSPASGCSEVTPRQMMEIYRGLGYDGIVLTNHFYQKENYTKDQLIDGFMADFEEACLYGAELGLQVYLGAEIRFTENINDYLVFGLNRKMLEEIYDLLPYGVAHFRKMYSMPNSLFVQAHPMRDGMQLTDPSLLDGIEVYNLHPFHNSRVGKAAVWARQNNLPLVIAGTDFHHKNCGHEGLTALRSKVLPVNSFDLAALLRSKDYFLELGQGDLLITD